MSEHRQYVAGFLIDPDARTVVLVRKGKPAWQAGRLNGVGGKIEPGESAVDAMRREFLEEAGVDRRDWQLFACVTGSWGSVWFFRAFGSTDGVRTMECEPIEVWAYDNLPVSTLPNLSWLIPLALYQHDEYLPVVAYERA